MAGTGALTFDAIRNKALASANISLSTTSFSQWPEFLYFVKKLGVTGCFINPESTIPVNFYEENQNTLLSLKNLKTILILRNNRIHSYRIYENM